MASVPRLRVSSPQPRTTASKQGEDSDHSRSTRGKPRIVLISFQELPEWHQDNECLTHGYRRISGSTRVSFHSWSYIHNESVNIFSHLMSGIVFLAGELYIGEYLAERYSDVTWTDYFIFAWFLTCCLICYVLSVGYHTLMNHSEKVESLWLRMDLIGIVSYQMGVLVSAAHMVFYCQPFQRKVYWSTTGILGFFSLLITTNPRFQGRKFRLLRGLTFTITFSLGWVIVFHSIIIFGWRQSVLQAGTPEYLGEVLLLTLGGILYGCKFPESRYPGKFNIYGSSHQLFHACVTLASVSHLIGMLKGFDYLQTHRVCPPY